MDDIIYVEQGGDPPGRWFEDGDLGLPVWKGPAAWRTRHGQAVMHWLLGRPYAAGNARTDDGRLTIQVTHEDRPSLWRRRREGPEGGWITGEVQVTPDDIVFRDHPGQVDPSLPDLGRDMERDVPFMSRMQDPAFANALYEHVLRGPYRQGTHPLRWTPGSKASVFAAYLNGDANGYILFEMGAMGEGPDGHDPARDAALLAEVGRHVARMGWTQLDRAEQDREHTEALADLAAAEARPEAGCPPWAEDWTPREPRCDWDRLLMAARAGKLTRAEHARIKERLRYGRNLAAPRVEPVG
jgi:hypothetical protein